LCTEIPTPWLNFLAMSPRGSKQKPTFLKVDERRISPDDVQVLIIERDRLAAADDRTEAQKWLGDPPPHRSALAQKFRDTPKKNSQVQLFGKAVLKIN
jgi:hypothetical protein